MTRPQDNPPLAAGLILLATAFIAVTTLLAKAIGTGVFGPPLHPLQVSHGRFVFAFLAIAGAMAVLRPQIARPSWGLHIGRTTFGWLGVSLMFAAVAFLPLSDATALVFLNPIFGMVLAIPLLGEKVGPVRWGAAAIAFVGAVILLRPSAATFQPAALLAILGALSMGVELIFIKRLTNRERPAQILFFNNLIGVGIASIAVVAVWIAPTPGQWAALAGIGLAMACAQACFINGMARADASFVAPFSYATLIFATLYDFGVFAVIPDAVSVVGAGTILAGALLLALREGRRGKPPVPPVAR
jgi:drug/metabolite transporter (DMT)-like permease